MPIQAEDQVVIPAIAEKQFDALWIYNLNVHAPTLNTGRVCVELLPYNSETKEIGPGSFMQAISTDKLWEAMEEVPEVALAFNAIINAVPALKTWIKAKEEEQRTSVAASVAP